MDKDVIHSYNGNYSVIKKTEITPLTATWMDLEIGPIILNEVHQKEKDKYYALLCQQIWKTQQWPQDCKRSVFIPIPQKSNAKECSNYRTIAFIS